MGKSKSEAAFKKLSKEMPPATKMGWDDNWDYKDVGMKVFADDKDRDQFIRESCLDNLTSVTVSHSCRRFGCGSIS